MSGMVEAQSQPSMQKPSPVSDHPHPAVEAPEAKLVVVKQEFPMAESPAQMAPAFDAKVSQQNQLIMKGVTQQGREHFLLFKNRLRRYTQMMSIPLPIYRTINEGSQHVPRFRSTVVVDGASYTSANTYYHMKSAEHDVANYAMDCISTEIIGEGSALIAKDLTFCKSVLYEFAAKINVEKPVYRTVQSKGWFRTFVSTVVFNGVTYKGAAGRKKKVAEQLAARAAILSCLGDPGTKIVLALVIKSKARFFPALGKAKDANVMKSSSVSSEVISKSFTDVSSNRAEEAQAGGGTQNLFVFFGDISPGKRTTVPVTNMQLHELLKPNAESSSQATAPLITFVPAVSEQPLASEQLPVSEQPPYVSSTPLERRKSRVQKKAEKRARIVAEMGTALAPAIEGSSSTSD